MIFHANNFIHPKTTLFSNQFSQVLAKNNLNLTNKLKHREDELKKLQKEYELSQKNLKDATANLSNIEYLDSTFNGDLNKSVTQSWNQQLLHMLLNEGKFTPTDVSNRMTEGKASWSRPKVVFLRLNYGKVTNFNSNDLQEDFPQLIRTSLKENQ